MVLRSRVTLDCTFEVYDADTPLNRTLRAAAKVVERSQELSADLRRRASRATGHLEEVGTIRPGDALIDPGSEDARYRAPVELARHILAGTGRSVGHGSARGQSFLIRTPELVEDALRSVAAEALAGRTQVSKATRLLRGSAHSLTPDLYFTDAVGDVKYKLWPGEWDRADLYQLAAFATGFRVRQGLRVGITDEAHDDACVEVGDVTLRCIDWVASAATPPSKAHDDLRQRIVRWWTASVQPSTSMSPRDRTFVRVDDLAAEPAVHAPGGTHGTH
jgi:5-methylcytosine-specific restriction endonuclease McrBC regulatory subunit McrC